MILSLIIGKDKREAFLKYMAGFKVVLFLPGNDITGVFTVHVYIVSGEIVTLP